MHLRRFLGVVGLALAIAGGIAALNLWLFVETPFGANPQPMRIERGAPVGEIVRRLERAGVVSNALLMKAFIKLQGAANQIRAGEYSFPAGLKPKELLALLQKGDFARQRITIPEGWTVRQIATSLGSQGLVDPERFLSKARDPQLIRSLGLPGSSLEGYLFPDTYEIYQPKDEEEVIRKLVGRFREVVEPLFASTGPDAAVTPTPQSPPLKLGEVVTLASIVERETALPSERPIVASVFLNRLVRGMVLASDPTVIYGIPNFSGNLTRRDLETPGPYNTYLNPGLPPTPIANPGLASIRAVLKPPATDFLYFVSRGDGTHQFSRTESEHQNAVIVYQRGGNRPSTLPARP